jgi:PAS domain S-box-containing protein
MEQKMKVLIVENEPVVRLLFEKQVRLSGFDVTACTDGKAALEAYKQTCYPLVVIDLGLPDVYGMDLCHQIRALSQPNQTLILVITERSDPEYLQAIIAAGANDYLSKPVNTELLKMRLTVLGQQMQRLSEYGQMEERLQHLKQAVETMQLGVTITDTTGKIVYTNPAEAEMHAYRMEDLLGRDVGVLAPQGLRKPLTVDQIKTVKHRERESVNIRKDGTIFPVRLLSDVLTDGQEAPVAIFTLSEDITEPKRALEQLRFQALLLDSVYESVIATDLEGRVLYWGKGAEALYGYTAAEVLGQTVAISVGPSEETPEEEPARQVLATGTWSGRYVHQRKDGMLFLSDTVISLMTDQTGQPRGLIAIDRDITERKQMEEILRYSEEHYRLLVESAADGIFTINEHGDLLSVNQAATQYVGKTPKDLVGENVSDLLPKNIVTAQLKRVKQVFRTGQVARLPEVSIQTSHGKKWFSTILTPIRSANGQVVYVLGITRDMTTRRRTPRRKKKK